MYAQWAFTIHPDNKEKVKEELRKLRSVIEKHGGKNFRYYASMTSETPNRLVVYEFEKFAHLDALTADAHYRAVKLDSLWEGAQTSIWGEVAI